MENINYTKGERLDFSDFEDFPKDETVTRSFLNYTNRHGKIEYIDSFGEIWNHARKHVESKDDLSKSMVGEYLGGNYFGF